MRDFRDAKSMAQTLRESLASKNFTITHSEGLEIVSKLFGCDNWNILSAKIEAERAANAAVLQRAAGAAGGQAQGPAPRHETLYCSFCGKSQHDVKKLIAGPEVFICDGCVTLCEDIVEEERGIDGLLADEEQGAKALEEIARAKSSEDLIAAKMRFARAIERTRKSLQDAQLVRDERAGGRPVEPLPADPKLRTPLSFLRSRSREALDEMVANYGAHLARIDRVSDAVRAVLRERGL